MMRGKDRPRRQFDPGRQGGELDEVAGVERHGRDRRRRDVGLNIAGGCLEKRRVAGDGHCLLLRPDCQN